MKQVNRFQTPQYITLYGEEAQLMGSKLVRGWGVLYKVHFYDSEGTIEEFIHHKEIEKHGNGKTIMELRKK